MKTKKKWLRKTTAICTAAFLSAAAIPSTAFAADSYSSIEKNAWAEKAKEMAGIYAASIEESEALVSGMQGDISLKLEDSGRSLLGFIAPFDVSWMNDLTLSTTSTFADGQTGTLMKLLLNDSLICTAEYYLDPESQDIFMRIPELSDKYFKTNLKEAADQQAASIKSDIEELTPDDAEAKIPADDFASAYSDSLSLSVSMMSDLSASLPEASAVETLLDKYGSMIFDNLTEVNGSQATLTAGDISQECTIYEGQISAADAVKTGSEILEAAKSDEDIKKILDTWTEKLSSDENLYDNFTKSIENGLDTLKDTDTSDSEESYIFTRIWVDEDSRIAGRELGIHENETDTTFLTWQMPKNGSDFGYLLSLTGDDNSVVLSGSGQIENDKLNGTYELSTDFAPVVNIEIKDYDTASAKNGYLNGSYTITFPASESEDADAAAIFENFALVLDLNSEKTSGTVALSVESAGSTLGTLSVVSGAGETVEIPDLSTLKDAYNATDEDDMSAYAATIDFTALMDNLSKAGVPEEVITYVLNGGASEENSSDADAAEDDASDAADSDAA